MTVTWRHRIVRVPETDSETLRETMISAIADGWIYVSRATGDHGTTDLVFRRADCRRSAWA